MQPSVLALATSRQSQVWLSSTVLVGGLFCSVLLATRDNEEDEDTLEPMSKTIPLPQDVVSKYRHGLLPLYIPTHQYTSCDFFDKFMPQKPKIPRSRTEKLMQETSTTSKLQSLYDVQWSIPLGVGGFGTVYLGTEKSTGESVAVKKIAKNLTSDSTFQQEMDAFLQIRQLGGHPNICGLRQHFDEGNFYYLILDLVRGGEMFDQLVDNGAYSEADAARLVREVASALAFLHGIGVVHGDLKPENLMLSSENSSDAVIKVVDLGCAQVVDAKSPFYNADVRRSIANTPGYSPPEVLLHSRDQSALLEPPVDMFALGIIVYIMLTGVHPFDVTGDAHNDEMNRRVRSKQAPPLRNASITKHLSPSAIELIEKLIRWDPKKRITALELLNDAWVRGETARTGKITDSDKRLKMLRAYKSRLEAKVFASMVQWSDDTDGENGNTKTSLIERSFHMLDHEHRGYITTQDLANELDTTEPSSRKTSRHPRDYAKEEDAHLSLSGFSDLLAENMKNRYFPAGHLIYHEGDKGHCMYFINSGRVEVFTKDGFKTITEQGNFFGEGALLDQKGRRNASIRCVTPVHVIEISREYFQKYLADGFDTALSLREKDKLRKRSRATTLLRLLQNLNRRTLKKGDTVYAQGEAGNDIYLIENGVVEVNVDNHRVFSAQPGDVCGEYAFTFGRPRNTTAKCTSDICTVQSMTAGDLQKLARSHPYVEESIRELALRREFQKALVFSTKKTFPTKEDELRVAFDAVDIQKSGQINLSDCALMLRRMDSSFTDKDISDILHSLDLDNSGTIHWEEFKRVFGMSGSGNCMQQERA
jgi:serine/threonine protein kinase/CRP-like cAMP-binding protein